MQLTNTTRKGERSHLQVLEQLINDNFNKLKQILDPSTTSFERKRTKKDTQGLEVIDTAGLYSD